MKILILGENCLIKLRLFYKTYFSTFSIISSVHAHQLKAVTPNNHIVKVLEGSNEIYFSEECDAVLIHFKTGTAIQAYRIADSYRKNGKTVILSGAHPTALPEEAKKHSDSVIVGSAEYLWPEVVRDLEKGEIKSYYRSKGVIPQDSLKTSNIDNSSNASIIGVIEATRGCPYKCDFCQDSNVVHGSVYRTRPVDEVIEEIKSFPQKFLFFCDVSLTVDVSYTKELFRKMKGLKKKFVCEGNADVLAKDEELLKLSYEAGCIEWTVGFESFTQEALDGVHKKTNAIEDFERVVKNVNKYKMALLGNFMFGFEYDKPEVFDITLKKINELGLNSARFAILVPYPGTPFFNKLDSEGRLLTKDWSQYRRRNVVFEPENMSKEELQNGFIKVLNDYNSAKNMIRRNIRSMKLGFYPFLTVVGRNLENYIFKRRTKL